MRIRPLASERSRRCDVLGDGVDEGGERLDLTAWPELSPLVVAAAAENDRVLGCNEIGAAGIRFVIPSGDISVRSFSHSIERQEITCDDLARPLAGLPFAGVWVMRCGTGLSVPGDSVADHGEDVARKGAMKLLLTDSGITNSSIHDALVDLLGKPIAESSALFIPTALYALPGGAMRAYRAISGGEETTSMAQLGWKTLGVLELTALPSLGGRALGTHGPRD